MRGIDAGRPPKAPSTATAAHEKQAAAWNCFRTRRHGTLRSSIILLLDIGLSFADSFDQSPRFSTLGMHPTAPIRRHLESATPACDEQLDSQPTSSRSRQFSRPLDEFEHWTLIGQACRTYPVFVISLESARVRRSLIEAHLNSLKIEYQIVTAVSREQVSMRIIGSMLTLPTTCRLEFWAAICRMCRCTRRSYRTEFRWLWYSRTMRCSRQSQAAARQWLPQSLTLTTVFLVARIEAMRFCVL